MTFCPFCHTAIKCQEDFVICPIDKTLHHLVCWEENGFRCATLQCPGSGDLPTHLLGCGRINEHLTIAEIIDYIVTKFPKISLPNISFPANFLRSGTALLGISISMATWGSLAGLVTGLLLPYLHFQLFSGIPIGLGVIFGLWKGLKTPTQEIQRGLYAIAGWLALGAVGELIANLAIIEVEVRTALFSYLPQTSIITLLSTFGALAGCFILEIRPNLLRGALGALFGYLQIEFFQSLWGPTIGNDTFLIIRFVILAFFVFIPLLWELPVLPLIGAFVSLACGVLVFLIRPKTDVDPYLLTLSVEAFLIGGANLVYRNRHSLNQNHPTLRDARQTILLGVVGFSSLSWGLAASFFCGGVLKIVIDFLLLKTVTSQLAITKLNLLSDLSISSITGSFQKYWPIIMVSYSVIYVVKVVSNNSLIKLTHQILRIVSLILLCSIFAYVTEQAFEFILKTWSLYNWFSSYISLASNALVISAIILGFLFSLIFLKDEVPFWAIATNFAIWFSQIIFLVAISIPVLGLLGIGLGEIYAHIANNANEPAFMNLSVKDCFGLIGSYAGLVIGGGYLLQKGLNSDLGWISKKCRQLSLNLFMKLNLEMDKMVLLRRRWWQILIFCCLSVPLLYIAIFQGIAK